MIWSALAAAVLIAGAVLLFWAPGFVVTTKLSHTAVENYIAMQLGADDVVCNGGRDITISQGRTFTCTAAGGAAYTVTITRSDGAHYTVRRS